MQIAGKRPVHTSEQGAKKSAWHPPQNRGPSANHISPSQNGPFHLPFATQHKEMSSKLRQELNECGFVIVQHLLLL
jgi:hypothetical protein